MKLSLGKFAPDRCDLRTMLDNVAIILRLVTINIDKNNNKRIPLVFHLTVFVAAAGYIYIYVFSMFWFVFVRCRETGDFTAAAVVFSLGVNSETSATKFLFMVIYKDKLHGMLQRYLESDSKVVPESRFARNLTKKLYVIKKRASFVWLAINVMSLAYVLLPLLMPGRHFTEDYYVIYGLEPMIESPNYEIASTFMSITILTGIYVVAGVTAFILVIIGYIEAHILTLSDEMLAVWVDAESRYEDIESRGTSDEVKILSLNKYIQNRLKEIITFQILDINLLNDFEEVFRITMAVDFFLITVGIVLELLGRIENTYLELPYTFLQIFMDCYIGQKLIDACNIFENAIYNCKWENFDKANMKTVCIMLQCSQKSLSLTAGGLVKLNFVCLMSAMKSTYSFYTTLQSTVNKT
ncbi:odorant receptor 59a-like [Bicyclus anynana]|uniref:Odorant receptor n=1 Tax=Bicyclus anynana TaxID=110368 RepID=A0A6J1NN31_BICAN|nr:odorant receptor 59a-like [Bicyclus anynana]